MSKDADSTMNQSKLEVYIADVASHADVLRLVTRSSARTECGEERVTSLRTSAWEATGDAKRGKTCANE